MLSSSIFVIPRFHGFDQIKGARLRATSMMAFKDTLVFSFLGICVTLAPPQTGFKNHAGISSPPAGIVHTLPQFMATLLVGGCLTFAF